MYGLISRIIEESLSLPAVQEAMRKGRPMIADFGERFVSTPSGGHGLTP